MNLLPATDLANQVRAFNLIHAAFDGGPPVERIPETGGVADSGTGIRWTWQVEPKSAQQEILRWVNDFSHGADRSVKFTIPLNCLDVNNLGLIARDDQGCLFLCRQTLDRDRLRSIGVEDPFATGWRGPNYRAFVVPGKPSSRIYFSCIALSDSREIILESFAAFFDGMRVKQKKITKDKAKKMMSDHYLKNKNRYPANVVSKRQSIIELLMQGIDVETAFQEALNDD